ncbi:hypothetical protein KAH81_04265 [bacterium]|nr:hypothetical protein [bacterium]
MSFLKICIFFLIAFSALSAEKDSLYYSQTEKSEIIPSNKYFDENCALTKSGHASLFARNRLVQNSRLSFGYSSNSRSSGSVLSYTHGIDYAFSSRLKTSVYLDIASVSFNGSKHTELTPAFRLDWRPNDNTFFRLNLKISPQTISGEDFLADPWHRPLGL